MLSPQVCVAAAAPLGLCSDDDAKWIARYSSDAGSDAATPYRLHAWQCHMDGQSAIAITEWKRALHALPQADPSAFQLHIWLGVDYQRTGSTQSALSEWSKGLALGRQQPGFKSDEKANTFFFEGNYSRALAAYKETALQDYNEAVFDSDQSHALYETAVAEAVGGRFDSSMHDLHAVLKSSPDMYAGHFLLGALSQIQTNKRQSISEWEATLFSFSADAPTSSISDRWHRSHWDALAMLLHYV
jgi:tetratricopeptide (TPR) repeat protein